MTKIPTRKKRDMTKKEIKRVALIAQIVLLEKILAIDKKIAVEKFLALFKKQLKELERTRE